MNIKWIRSNKGSIKFVLSLALIGLITGIILYFLSSNSLKQEIVNKVTDLIKIMPNTHLNNILYHLLLLSVLLVLSICVLGNIFVFFYYYYEFVSIGYFLAILFNYKKFNGILFGSIYMVITKLIFLIVLIYLVISSLKYSKSVIKHHRFNNSNILLNHLYKFLLAIIIVFLNDILLYYIGNKLILLFSFLL